MQNKEKSLNHWIILLKQETNCPICLHTLEEPVTTACHHTFCRACINPVLKESPSVCPLCKEKITRRGTKNNLKTKTLVQKVGLLVNAFKNESGVDLQWHHEDIAATIQSRNNEEGEMGKDESQAVDFGTELGDSGKSRLEATVPENIPRFCQGKDNDRYIVEECSGQNSTLLNESYGDIDHMSISQNVPANLSSGRKKSTGAFSMSLKKHAILAGTPKLPEEKVEEWLCMDKTASASPTVSKESANSPLNVGVDPDDKILTSLNQDRNNSKRASCENVCGKRVYGQEKIPEDTTSKRLGKPVLSNDEVWDEVGPTSDMVEAFSDSCPVDVNDRFDKLVSEFREQECKSSSKRDPTPEIFATEQEENDVALYDSLPMPTDKEISRKCTFNHENRKQKKRNPYSEDNTLGIINKNDKTLVVDAVNAGMKVDNCAPFSTTLGDSVESNFQVPKDGIKKQGTNLLNEKSSTSRCLMPEVVDPVKGIKSRKGERRRRSGKNTTLASPGWSRLRSARKDFQSKKKETSLPALNVSGGVPCNASASRPRSSRKTLELNKSNPPLSYVSIDDNESSVDIHDDLEQKSATVKTIVKNYQIHKDIQKNPTNTPLIAPIVEVSEHIPLPVTPLKGISLGLSEPKQVTNTPSSVLPTSDVSLQRTVEMTSPVKFNEVSVSPQKLSSTLVISNLQSDEPKSVESSPFKTPSKRIAVRFCKLGLSNQKSLSKVQSDDSKGIELHHQPPSTPAKSPSKIITVDAPKQILATHTIDPSEAQQLQSSQKPCARLKDISQLNLNSESTSGHYTSTGVATLEPNLTEARQLEECSGNFPNASSPHVEGPQAATSSSVKGDKEVEILEVVIHTQRNENSSSSCSSIKSPLKVGNSSQISSSRSPHEKQKYKNVNPVVVERKTFSLDTNTEDLSELADLRESTEDQLEGIKMPEKARSPELECSFQRIRPFIQGNNCITAGGKINESTPRVSMGLWRRSSKHYPVVTLEKSIRKKSISRKPKTCVPVFKMGPLNRKGLYSGRRVSFYMLGNVRQSSGTVNTAEVGVEVGVPIGHQNRLSNRKEAISRKCIDIGVQTKFSPGRPELGSPLGENTRAVKIGSVWKSPLVPQPHSAIDENFNPLQNFMGEVNVSDYKTKEGKCEDDKFERDMDASCGAKANETHSDLEKGFSVGECSSLAARLHTSPRKADQEIQFSVGDSSLDIIPDSERSGFKISQVKSLAHSRSHRKHKPIGRNLNAKKAVCQLFSNAESDQGEMALPLGCTQISKAEEETFLKTVVASESKESDTACLFSESTSDHEGEEIEKNLKKRKRLRSQRKYKPEARTDNRKGSPILKESLSPNLEEDSNPMHCVEDMALDSEEMDRKLKLIVANIEADMNIRKGKKNCSESVDCETSEPEKDGSDEYIEEVPIDTNSLSPSIVPETHPLHLTCVEESESEHEYEKDNDLEKNNDGRLKDDELNDPPILKDCSGEESDFFIEGSQKDVGTLEKSVVVNKPPISLVTSGLQVNELMLVRQLARIFNLHFSPVFCAAGNSMNIPHTTHVIAKTDEFNKAECTFKYLCGVVSGSWIVSLHWVTDCLKTGRLLGENPYEVLDDSGNPGPFIGRTATVKLFEGLEFYFKKPFLGVTTEQMKVIVELGGGKTVSEIEEFSGMKGMQIAVVGSAAMDCQDFYARLAQRNIAVVATDWVADSIGQYRLQPLVEHVLNLSPNPTSFSQCQQALLAMGYHEDMLGNEEEQMELCTGDGEDEQMEECSENEYDFE